MFRSTTTIFAALCLGLILPTHSALASDAKRVVYVYHDEGVSENAFGQAFSTLQTLLGKRYAIESLNADQVKKGQWVHDAALYVMPGGEDIPYTRKLDGLGNRNIRHFVENGGAYLGLCAGAYYAATAIEFDKGGPLAVTGERELKFFPGKVIGPVLAPYDYETESGSRAAHIATVFETVPHTTVYYNGGGYFEHAERFNNTHVLARYDNGLPAIVSITDKDGKVVLSGVHFEYDPQRMNAQDPYFKKIIPTLTQANASREMLAEKLLSILGLYPE